MFLQQSEILLVFLCFSRPEGLLRSRRKDRDEREPLRLGYLRRRGGVEKKMAAAAGKVNGKEKAEALRCGAAIHLVCSARFLAGREMARL
ncbi:unnamed protein product [Amoebophrya sp. A120]|nr:unnamed protein product [Amoebophrya sp. A120]|eukprot:GSA120T00021344001.1